MKCELCGSQVKIVGGTTKHYEPFIENLDREVAIQKMVKVLKYVMRTWDTNECKCTDIYAKANKALEAWRKINK